MEDNYKMEMNRQEMKKWVVENMIACECGTLPDELRGMFLDLVEEQKDTEFMDDCFRTFMIIKFMAENQ